MLKIIGKSRAAEQIRRFIHKAAQFDFPVLLVGETGAGKEVTAKLIHRQSQRKEAPFLALNCANVPDSLAESELFGHRKGAFTDAREEKQGLIESANRGTLFLDEVAEFSFSLQAKLLRVLEEGSVRRIGENKSRSINVRFIFATNRDLKKEIQKGNFRQALYFRINTLKLEIPALRERKEDIPLFVEKIIQEANEAYGKAKKLKPRALAKLLEYSFPGNIRELENILRRTYALAEAEEIDSEDIILEEEEEEEIVKKLYQAMVLKGRSFWEVAHIPFLRRDLNRREVKSILSMGLNQCNGSYKKLGELFHIGEAKNNYKRFLKIIEVHKLR